MAVGSDVWAAHDLQFMEIDNNPAVDDHQPVENSSAARLSTGDLANGHSAGDPIRMQTDAATSAGAQQGAEVARQDVGAANEAEATVQSLQQELVDKNARIARLEAELLAVRYYPNCLR